MRMASILTLISALLVPAACGSKDDSGGGDDTGTATGTGTGTGATDDGASDGGDGDGGGGDDGTDPCAAVDCGGAGHCVDDGGSAVCLCDDGTFDDSALDCGSGGGGTGGSGTGDDGGTGTGTGDDGGTGSGGTDTGDGGGTGGLPDGEPCGENSECASGYCYPGVDFGGPMEPTCQADCIGDWTFDAQCDDEADCCMGGGMGGCNPGGFGNGC